MFLGCALCLACSDDAKDDGDRGDASVDAAYDAFLIDAPPDAPGSGGSAGTGAGGCPAKTGLCPAGCVSIQGAPIDAALGCVASLGTIGCRADAGAGGAVIGCVQDPVEGLLYQTPSSSDSQYLIGTGAWSECPGTWSLVSLPCP